MNNNFEPFIYTPDVENDLYKTIAEPAEAIFKDKSSKFLAFAYPVTAAEQVKEYVDGLKKRFYDATHHCYAYRMGVNGEEFRVNDDGEPSGTAGRPILGQMMSAGVTDCLVVVVRYFGGTKLGVPGLINAYKESAAAVLEAGRIVEKTEDTIFDIVFPYVNMNDIMKIVKDEQPQILSQNFDNTCAMKLSIRRSSADKLLGRLEKVEGVSIETSGGRNGE